MDAMTRGKTAGALIGLFMLVVLTPACVNPIDTSSSPCPCADGWVCCSEKLCVPKGTNCPGCTDRCPLDSARCTVEGGQRCARQEDGCTDWSAPVACSANQACVNGACECQQGCPQGESRCWDDGVQHCEVAADGCLIWAPVQPCQAETACWLGECHCFGPDQACVKLSVSPEVGTDAPIVTGAYGSPLRPVMASDGTNTLVFWADQRGGCYGTRLAPDGSVLDPNGIRISPDVCDYTRSQLALAFDGSNYLLLSSLQLSSSKHVFSATRISPQGEVLDPLGIELELPDCHGSFVLVFDGNNHLAAWPTVSGVRATRMAPDGTLLDPDGIVLSQARSHEGTIAAACGAQSCMVVWSDDRFHPEGGDLDLFAARVAFDGSVIDPGGVAISTGERYQLYPGLAAGGTSYLVAWHDKLEDGTTDIQAALIPADGPLTQPSIIPLLAEPIEDSGWDTGPLAVAFDGENFLVPWYEEGSNGGTIWGMRVSPEGQLRDRDQTYPGILLAHALINDSYLAAIGSELGFRIVWPEDRYANDQLRERDVFVAGLTPAGQAAFQPREKVVSTSANAQIAPAIAFNRSSYLMAWRDSREVTGHAEIYAARLDAEGQVQDQPALQLSYGGNPKNSGPEVASAGDGFLVVWSFGNTGILARLVNNDGSLPHEFGLPQGGAWYVKTESPTLAASGDQYLVVWSEDRGGGHDFDLYAARVSATGVVLDQSSIAVSTLAGSDYAPAVASDGRDFLVVWKNSYKDQLLGRRIGASGESLDHEPLVLRESTFEHSPKVAYGAGIYLVVFENSGVRLRPDGTLLDADPVVLTPQYGPALAFDGSTFLLAWQQQVDADPGLYVTRITPALRVLNPDPEVVCAGQDPALASDGAGQVLLAYPRYDSSPELRSLRLYTRLIGSGR